MIFLDKKRCAGCTACRAICPHGAIEMKADAEGFQYPDVSSSRCVKCGLCRKACPILNGIVRKEPHSVYAAKAKDDAVRASCSSGGIFPLLAEYVLQTGGIVYGAAFSGEDWHVEHIAVEDIGQLVRLKESKYVQSEVNDLFRSVAATLKIGRRVLFSGTPCQIAGLRLYLEASRIGKPDSLLLVEVICHGVPSPLAWRKYLEKRTDGRLRTIRRISSRRKNCGWKRFSMSLGFANGMEYLKPFPQDAFMRGFLAELYSRPSCHDCPCRDQHSCADLILGDFWGIEKTLPDFDDDKGTSAVIVMTDVGCKALSVIEGRCELRDAKIDDVGNGNRALRENPIPHRNRNRFFRLVGAGDFDDLVSGLLKPSLCSGLRSKIGVVMRRIGIK